MVIGLKRSAVGTFVERTTRLTMLIHLPRDGYRVTPRTKNGPALAGYGAITHERRAGSHDDHVPKRAASVLDLAPRQRAAPARRVSG